MEIVGQEIGKGTDMDDRLVRVPRALWRSLYSVGLGEQYAGSEVITMVSREGEKAQENAGSQDQENGLSCNC